MTQATTDTQAADTFGSMQTALSAYIRKGEIRDFGQFSFYEKLALVQKIPRDRVKTRDVGGQKISYLEHAYCQQILNFVFNFEVSSYLEQCEYMPGVSNKGAKYWECDVTMRFEFIHPVTGNRIVRTVGGSHKLYESPAACKGFAKQAAISKAWTAVAGTFGIGKNLKYAESKQYDYEAKATSAPVVNTTPY